MCFIFSLILLFWHSRFCARDQPVLYLLKVSSTDLRKNEEDVFENGSDHFEFVIIKVLKDKHDNGGDDPNEQVDASLKKKEISRNRQSSVKITLSHFTLQFIDR